jgi:hypothetical protein
MSLPTSRERAPHRAAFIASQNKRFARLFLTTASFTPDAILADSRSGGPVLSLSGQSSPTLSVHKNQAVSSIKAQPDPFFHSGSAESKKSADADENVRDMRLNT